MNVSFRLMCQQVKQATARAPYLSSYPTSAGLAWAPSHEMLTSDGMARGVTPESAYGAPWEGKRMRETAPPFNVAMQGKREISSPSSPTIGTSKEGERISPDKTSELTKAIKKRDPVGTEKEEVNPKKKKKNPSSWGRVPREVSAAIQEELLNLVQDFEAEIPAPTILREVANRSGCLVSVSIEVMPASPVHAIGKTGVDKQDSSKFRCVSIMCNISWSTSKPSSTICATKCDKSNLRRTRKFAAVISMFERLLSELGFG